MKISIIKYFAVLQHIFCFIYTYIFPKVKIRLTNKYSVYLYFKKLFYKKLNILKNHKIIKSIDFLFQFQFSNFQTFFYCFPIKFCLNKPIFTSIKCRFILEENPTSFSRFMEFPKKYEYNSNSMK